MSSPFLGEIRIIGFNFAPPGWALCDGFILPINQNQTLFSLLGTTYGGDGQTTFGLPDLRGRTPIHEGSGHSLGQSSGQEGVALTAQQMPQHDHTMQASSNPASVAEVAGAVPAESAQNTYVASPPTGNLNADSVANGNPTILLWGGVRFNEDILGLIITDSSLDDSDYELGYSGTVYPTGLNFRGLNTAAADMVGLNGRDISFALPVNGVTVSYSTWPSNSLPETTASNVAL